MTSWAESYPVGLAKAIASCLQVETVVNEVAAAQDQPTDVSNLLADEADSLPPGLTSDSEISELCCGACDCCSGQDCDFGDEWNFTAEVDDLNTSRFLSSLAIGDYSKDDFSINELDALQLFTGLEISELRVRANPTAFDTPLQEAPYRSTLFELNGIWNDLEGAVAVSAKTTWPANLQANVAVFIFGVPLLRLRLPV